MHPLIPIEEGKVKNSHYQKGSKVAIEEAEQILTVCEMIGACKFNIFKYEFRKELKGVKEADEKKIETYKAYLKELEDMAYLSLHNHYVSDAIRITQRDWVYRAEELVDVGGLF